jgi:hypothetical protein
LPTLLAIVLSNNKFLSDAPVPMTLFGQWLFVWSLLAEVISSYFGLLPDFYRRSRGKPELQTSHAVIRFVKILALKLRM